MSTDERSLADAQPPAPETVDVTERPDTEDFDWDAFLAGVRPTRRAVRVYARADLVAHMEEVAASYRDDLPAAEKKRIRNEVQQLRDDFEASGRWFVAEARSNDWREKFREEAAKRLGMDLDTIDNPPEDETAEQRTKRVKALQQMTLEQVAAQVVIPSGVTATGLQRLGDLNEGELNKIVAAVAFANGQQAEAAGVLTRDFSPAPSAQKRGSAKR